MRRPSTATLLVKDGMVVLTSGALQADVVVQGERIKAVGHGLPVAHDTVVVEAKDCFVLPGVIDGHTHIALDTGVYQTVDDWYVGTRAAAYGGVTTVLDFATQFPGQSLMEVVTARVEEARDAVVDYGLHVMITDLPLGNEAQLSDLLKLGTPSIKLYTTYRPHYFTGDADLLRLFGACAGLGIVPLVHCENDDLIGAQVEELRRAGEMAWRNHGRSRPALAELEAVERVLLLAQAAKCPVHIVHCSVAQSVEAVSRARAGGLRATCETCPQYLLLDSTAYKGSESWRYVVQPPLREPGEPDRLWTMVVGGMVDLIATDHCDYSRLQKTVRDDFSQTPGGLPGLETILPLMYTYGVAEDRISLPDLTRLLSTGPAQTWGLWPRKGAILPGSDADLVVYDPESSGSVSAAALHQEAGYSPYEGMRLQGQVRTTISRGRVIYRDGRFTGRKGRGKFLRRGTSNRATMD